jgi:hypothetical protein
MGEENSNCNPSSRAQGPRGPAAQHMVSAACGSLYGANVRADGAKFFDGRDGVGPADPNVTYWVEETHEWDRGNRAWGKRTATATRAAEHRVPGGQQRST